MEHSPDEASTRKLLIHEKGYQARRTITDPNNSRGMTVNSDAILFLDC